MNILSRTLATRSEELWRPCYSTGSIGEKKRKSQPMRAEAAHLRPGVFSSIHRRAGH
jgi:hypothetical protein